MTFTMRVLRAAGWFVAGFLTAVGQGLFGSKLHGLLEKTPPVCAAGAVDYLAGRIPGSEGSGG